ncbi:MAG: hypothetical protein ABSG90_11800 [Dehalococcoidia bacterium]|jgi:hypothetical protein
MAEFDWDDFISDLCRDLLHGVDLTRILERTKLSANTIGCHILRTKPQIPNSK